MAHALLSPSAASRWLHCTAAPRLEEMEPERSSSYADEGTLAHAIGALLLKQHAGAATAEEMREIMRLEEQYRTAEMDEAARYYADLVIAKLTAARLVTGDAWLAIEQRLDLDFVSEGMFGTADAVVIADGTMDVVDLKYGKGVKVSAYRNPQMMIYALGALEIYCIDYRIDRVRMTIVQPRLDHVSDWEISAKDLRKWMAETLIPAAKEAYNGGEQHPGEWCRFCKVRGKCKALMDDACAVSRSVLPGIATPEDIAEALGKVEAVEGWCKAVKENALEMAMSGKTVPGYKVVAGRSVRKVTDHDAVGALLVANGYRADEVFKPRELRGLTELEKVVGKKRFAELAKDYIEKPEGKPTLVEESDKREALGTAASDFAEYIEN